MNKKLSLSNLSSHIKKLQTQPQKITDTVVFWGTAADKSYLPHLKSCVGSYTVFVRLEPVTVLQTVAMYCQNKRCSKVITSSPTLLRLLLDWKERAAPSVSNYSGSYFTIPALKEGNPDIEVVFIPPLKQLVTISYGKFITTRLITKLTDPDKWFKPPTFKWQVLYPENEEMFFNIFSSPRALLIGVDVETFKTNATLRCVGFTVILDHPPEGFESQSVVIPVDSDYNLAILRKWCWELKAPKVFQNGKYDVAYLSRYNSPVFNYLYDTANMFHAWYSELPKDLGFLNSFFIREATYWKDLSNTNDLHEYYRYNALDTWGTACTFLAMMLEAPQYAIDNYLLEFPNVFPCHMAEMRGIERDMNRLAEARKKADTTVAEKSARLDKILGVQGFNVKSPPQVKELLKILGCSDLKSTDEKNLEAAKFRHPFNELVLTIVLDIRESRTLREKYLQIGEKAKEFHRPDGTGNRILFSLNPHGTDTSRLASTEHHFWTGLQIQNIPKDDSVKCTLRADPDFYLAEVDLEQAESRDTAYIAGEDNLIDNVEFSPDFHCANASAFFGIPFTALYDIETNKKLNVAIRDIAKNVNHGANYNMGPKVLVVTMGIKNIFKAKNLLKLPKFWGSLRVAEYLLEQFHKTYPGLKGVYYERVVEEVKLTSMIISRAVHYCDNEADYIDMIKEEGTWVRRCFGNPDNKRVLNAYVAHPPQSLNAQTLNKAWWRVFKDIAINPEHMNNFKLLAQIHDSILFQYRIGHSYLCDMVKERMEIPVTIKGYDGKIKTFTVPAGIKAGTEDKPATYWSETE